MRRLAIELKADVKKSQLGAYVDEIPFDPKTAGYVRLPTDVRDEYLSDHTIKMLTVKRAFNEDGKIVVNPLSYYACEGSGGVLIVLRAFRLVV